MSVLFIGKRFYTNRDALRERYGRIYQLPWHWSQAGIETQLWLVDYHTRETLQTSDGALKIVSTPVRNLALFRHWLSRAYMRTLSPSVVVASGDCYIGWLGWCIARRLRARFVFDVYDKYDEFGGYHTLPGVDLFGYLLDKAAVSLYASRPLMMSLASDDRRALLAPNGIDISLFHPRDLQESRKQFHIRADELCVGYFGSMTPDRGADDLVSAVSLLRSRGLNIKLMLAGHEKAGTDRPDAFVRYLGNLPYDEVPVAMACCDVLALPYRRSAYLDMASSCKIAEYLAVGRPLVATRTPNFASNFADAAEQLGPLLAEPSNPEDLARVIAAQLRERRLVGLSEGMSWRVISNEIAQHVDLTHTPKSERV